MKRAATSKRKPRASGASIEGTSLHDPLLAWYSKDMRKLPWRETRDSYAIWVSEIMLQQTQVATVVPYFERWMQRFPTVQQLAKADEQEVLAAWQGLGYYRRAKMLLTGAKHVARKGWPANAKAWRSMPGVGRYTASAISSIALGEPIALVDGNVERVFARLTECREPKPRLTHLAWKWAEENLCRWSPGEWNQALMELGATVCTPTAPSCVNCPLQDQCISQTNGSAMDLPISGHSPKTIHLKRTLWVPRYGELWGVRQIPDGQWSAGMWEFPWIAVQALSHSAVHPFGDQSGSISHIGMIRHSVTHHRIELTVLLVFCDEKRDGLYWVDERELAALPMPSPMRRAIAFAKGGQI